MLKKSFIIFGISTLLFIGCPVSLKAQQQIGIYGGYNSSIIREPGHFTYEGSYNSKPGYKFGIHYKERKNNIINLSFDLEYLYRNLNYESLLHSCMGECSREYLLDFKTHSFNIEILPEICYKGRIILYANLGPYVGYIFKSSYSGKTLSSDVMYSEKNDYEYLSGNAKEILYGLDYGIASSMGFQFPITNKISLLSEMNYSFGMNDLTNGWPEYYDVKLNTKNVSIILGLAYKLTFNNEK